MVKIPSVSYQIGENDEYGFEEIVKYLKYPLSCQIIGSMGSVAKL